MRQVSLGASSCALAKTLISTLSAILCSIRYGLVHICISHHDYIFMHVHLHIHECVFAEQTKYSVISCRPIGFIYIHLSIILFVISSSQLQTTGI